MVVISPRGFSGVREASSQVRDFQSGPSALWFRLRSGEETIVRFLEQDDDIYWCYKHEIPVEGRQWGKLVTCLDQERDGQDCPGCERDMKRKFQGYINLIWDDAPVFKRDGEGKMVRDKANDPIVIENKPQVAIWSSGIRLFEELDEINANFKGLTSRRFKVKRKGEKLDTKYVITPEDTDAGAQPLSDAESKLAAEKFDLSEHTTPGTYEEFMEDMGEPSVGYNGDESQRKKNPFMRS